MHRAVGTMALRAGLGLGVGVAVAQGFDQILVPAPSRVVEAPGMAASTALAERNVAPAEGFVDGAFQYPEGGFVTLGAGFVGGQGAVGRLHHRQGDGCCLDGLGLMHLVTGGAGDARGQ